MGNFEYIISSLPFLTTDYQYAEGQGFSQVMQEIRENLSEKDARALDFFLKGFQDSELNPDFYTQALEHPQAFIRDYFRFDLSLRNAKVRYLNQALGRPLETDVITLTEEEVEVEEKNAVETALALGDLLSREKDLEKAEDIVNQYVGQGWTLQQVAAPADGAGALIGVFYKESKL